MILPAGGADGWLINVGSFGAFLWDSTRSTPAACSALLVSMLGDAALGNTAGQQDAGNGIGHRMLVGIRSATSDFQTAVDAVDGLAERVSYGMGNQFLEGSCAVSKLACRGHDGAHDGIFSELYFEGVVGVGLCVSQFQFGGGGNDGCFGLLSSQVMLGRPRLARECARHHRGRCELPSTYR